MIRSAGLICLLAAIPAIAAASQSAVAASEKLMCPHTAGYIDGPFVPTAAGARKIYLVIRDAITPWQRAKRNLRVKVDDDGHHWDVYATKPIRKEAGKLVVARGGGDLSLQIDKCTGAVTKAALAK